MSTYPKDFFDSSKGSVAKGRCFVIMPFGNPYDEIYHEVFRPVASEYHLEVIRADERFGSYPIMGQILAEIESAEFILVDLTDAKANVLYELGIAHARKPNESVILLSQSMYDVPSDLRHLEVVNTFETVRLRI